MGLRAPAVNRIAAWRTYRGFSQKGLADRLGISAAAVRAWEADLTIPNPTHLAMLCSLLRCSRRDLYPDY